jgi:hypothetical protein
MSNSRASDGRSNVSVSRPTATLQRQQQRQQHWQQGSGRAAAAAAAAAAAVAGQQQQALAGVAWCGLNLGQSETWRAAGLAGARLVAPDQAQIVKAPARAILYLEYPRRDGGLSG